MQRPSGPVVIAILDLAFLFCALVAIGSSVLQPMDGYIPTLVFRVFKPLATTLVILRVAILGREVSNRRSAVLFAAMLFALGGDIALLFQNAGFIIGLGCFFVAHVLFLARLTMDARRFAAPAPFVLLAIFGAVNLYLLWPELPPPLRLPVSAYVAILLLMAAQANGRWIESVRDGRQKAVASAGWVACGANLFVVSDTLLAWNRFHAPFVLAPAGILGTYYAAIYLISNLAADSPVKRVAG